MTEIWYAGTPWCGFTVDVMPSDLHADQWIYEIRSSLGLPEHTRLDHLVSPATYPTAQDAWRAAFAVWMEKRAQVAMSSEITRTQRHYLDAMTVDHGAYILHAAVAYQEGWVYTYSEFGPDTDQPAQTSAPYWSLGEAFTAAAQRLRDAAAAYNIPYTEDAHGRVGTAHEHHGDPDPD